MPGERVDVPVRQVVLPDGVPRYSVPVSVGTAAPIEAQLDTGSFGLRVLASALKSNDYASTGIRRASAFGSGVRLGGVLARATINVGGVQTSAPVVFEVVDHVDCADRAPDCPASRVAPGDYRIGGDGYPGQGFPAILGLSMRRAATDDSAQNPLTATGPRSWILLLPRPGEAEPGHLIVDPDAEDRAGFVLFKLPRVDADAARLSGWADTALPACLADEGGPDRFCGRTLLDTGAPGVSVATESVDRPRPWGAGREARITIGKSDDHVSVSFTSGADASSRVILHPPRGPAGGMQLSAGTLPYFDYAVLYDAEAGTIGFKPRDPVGP